MVKSGGIWSSVILLAVLFAALGILYFLTGPTPRPEAQVVVAAAAAASSAEQGYVEYVPPNGRMMSGWTDGGGNGQNSGGHVTPYLDTNWELRADDIHVTSPDPTGITKVSKIRGTADNGSGKIRLTVNSTSGLQDRGWYSISGVTGTTEANGYRQLAILDSTHVDIIGSKFEHSFAPPPNGNVNDYGDGYNISTGPLDIDPYVSMNRLVRGRAPQFFDAIGMYLMQGQVTEDPNHAYPYAGLIAEILDPSKNSPDAHALISLGVTAKGGEFYPSFGVMKGVLSFGPGYWLPGDLQGTQANFKAVDKGYGTFNSAIGYYVANAPIGQAPAGSARDLSVASDGSKVSVSAAELSLRRTSDTVLHEASRSLPAWTTVTNVKLTINPAAAGLNGIDLGGLSPATTFYVWALFNSSTGATGAILSRSADSPNTPAGFDYRARVDEVATDDSGRLVRSKREGSDKRFTLSSNTSLSKAFAKSSVFLTGGSYTVLLARAGEYGELVSIRLVNTDATRAKRVVIPDVNIGTIRPGQIITAENSENSWRITFNAIISQTDQGVAVQ